MVPSAHRDRVRPSCPGVPIFRPHPPEVVEARQAQFEVLVLPQLDRLVAFAFRQLGNRLDAEDVVQEACVRAWVHFDALRSVDSLRPWLYRIVRTTLSDFCDRRGRREQLAPMVPLEAADGAPADTAAPQEELIRLLNHEQLLGLLALVPEEFSLAVQLHDLEGFGYREIAEIIEAPLGTVMSRIYRGRKLLAELVATRAAQVASRAAAAEHAR